MSAGSTVRVAGFVLEAVAPEPGAPGDQVGAAYLGLRVVAPSGRSFCDFSDLDLDAQTVAAARLRGPCTYLLLPSGGRSRPSRSGSGPTGVCAMQCARPAQTLRWHLEPAQDLVPEIVDRFAPCL